MHKRGVIRKVTFYYLSVLFTLMIIVSLALNITFISYKKDIVDTAQMQYQTYLEKIDIQLQQFSNVAKDMYMDSELRREVLEKGNIASINGIKKIKLYKSSLSLAEEVFLCFEDGHVFAESGSYSRKTWEEQFFAEEDIPVFQDALIRRADNECIIVQSLNGKKGLLYMYSSPALSRINSVQIGIFVSEKQLKEQLAELMLGRDGVLVMATDKDEVIFDISFGEEDFFKQELIGHVVDMQLFEYSDYTIFHCESELMDYKVHVALQTSYLWDRQLHLQITILSVGILLFLVIAIVIFVINKKFYHPISKLAELASLQNDDVGMELYDEYTTIRMALERNREKNARHVSDFRFLQIELRKSLALLLMSGKIEGSENLSALIKQYDLFAKDEQYAVIGLLGTGNMRVAYESLREDSDFGVCFLETVPEGYLLSVLVVLLDDDNDGQYRKALGKQLKEKVEESESICLGIYSGMVYCDILQIYRSYDEMCSSIELSKKKTGVAKKTTATSKTRQSSEKEKVIEYIKENYLATDLSIEMVAEKFGIPRQKVYSIIKEKEGVTYVEYLTRLRCEKACELLENTELTIQEIVQRVGWYDTRNFTRKFKLNYGVTPGEYRQNKKDI